MTMNNMQAYHEGAVDVMEVVARTLRAMRNPADANGQVVANGSEKAMLAIANALDEKYKTDYASGLGGHVFKSLYLDVPLKWKRVDEARYEEMLGILPPATMTGYGFLVGEAWDHHPIKGHPRYAAFVQIGGTSPDAGFYESTRPMGRTDFRNLDMMAVPKNLETGEG